MEFVNCPRCGRVFTKINKPVCPDCVREDEEAFESVRAYIKENPACTLTELSEVTHVSIKRITQYIRDGRLEVTKSMGSLDLTCSLCGRPILTGRVCNSCALKLHQDVLAGKKKSSDDIKHTGSFHVNRDK